MPVFELSDDHAFPPADLAEPDGLLAVGGDLSEGRLLSAYRQGIFPWYSEPWPVLWWSPDPRLILMPGEVRVSRSLRQTIRKGVFHVTMDCAFSEVIRRCSDVHRAGDGNTWITQDMIKAYIRLHDSGYAHSVEAWHKGELAGGLYGVSLGSAYFGESMFTAVSNASKVALVCLAQQLRTWKFDFIDCQVRTRHLLSLGAREVPRKDFMSMLRQALLRPTLKGKWEYFEGIGHSVNGP